MPTPTSAERRLHAIGAKKAATWGTAVALGATDEILLEGASGLDAPDIPIIPALESDRPYVKQSDLGLVTPLDVSLPVAMRYEMGAFGRLVAMIFGTAGAPTQQGTTAAYKHVFQWKDNIEGLFATLAEERAGKIFEMPSAKPFRLELSFTDGILKAALSMRGNTCIDNSSVNTATQMDALTVPSDFEDTRLKFSHLSVKMNAESGGDVSGETVLDINDLNIVIDRILEAGQHVAGSDKIQEPREEGHPGPSTLVTLSFPRMDSVNAAYFQTRGAGTTQKMLVKFTGALIEETYYYDFSLFFPRLKMQKPSYTVEEIVKAGLVLQAEEAASNPTGMDYSRIYAEIINKQTTDYLA